MDEPAAQAVPSSDADLITATASGDTAAYGALAERHAAAARSLAGLLSADPAEAETISSDAFTRLRQELRVGSGPLVALRPHLFLAVRWAAYRRLHPQQAQIAGGRDADTTPDSQEPLFADPAVGDLVWSPLNRAFLSRPERSRAVLWHLDVEQIGPAQTAAILGLTQEGVFEFAGEARAGLRHSYLSQYVAGTPREDCASAMAALGIGADGQLTRLDDPAVAQHLGACPDCQAAVGELSDLGQSLCRVIAPIYLGTAAAAYLQASLGGLHWTRELRRAARSAPRSRRALAVACGLLAAAAATGLALMLTAGGPGQHTAAQARPAATARPSSQPASVPPVSPPAGSVPSASPTAPSPGPASPSPPPVTTSPSPQPTVPLPSPTPPGHHRHHHPPFT